MVKSGFNSYRRTTLAKPYALEFCENENNFDDSFFKTTKDNPGKTMHIRILWKWKQFGWFFVQDNEDNHSSKQCLTEFKTKFGKCRLQSMLQIKRKQLNLKFFLMKNGPGISNSFQPEKFFGVNKNKITKKILSLYVQAIAARQAMLFLQSSKVLVRSVNWSPNGSTNLDQSSSLSS